MVRPTLLVLAFTLPATSLSSQNDTLSDRLEAAQASENLRQSFFAAASDPPLTIEQAFPHLAGAPLADVSFLAARRETLRTQRDARARERLGTADSDDGDRVRAACDAEDAAAALEERLLASLVVGLERAFEGWLHERRRGIVAVIGDHGMGKSVFLDQAEGHLAGTSMLFALQLTLKAYVFDGRFETAFATDVTERVKQAFRERSIRTVSDKITLETVAREA